jgi:hypothetical protein
VVNDLGLPAKTRFACGLELRSFVPQGHKVALSDIAEGAVIRRYNEVDRHGGAAESWPASGSTRPHSDADAARTRQARTRHRRPCPATAA